MLTEDRIDKFMYSSIGITCIITIIILIMDCCYWEPAREKAMQMQREKNLKTEYNSGMQAAQLGIGANANPHIGDRYRRDEAQSWLKGYMDGKSRNSN